MSHLLQGAALDVAVAAAGGEVCDVLVEAAHLGWEEIGSLRALKP
ncbi:hypothetical protein PTR23_08680 [Serratia nevei]